MRRIYWIAAGAVALAACAPAQETASPDQLSVQTLAQLKSHMDDQNKGQFPDQLKQQQMKVELEQVLAQAKVGGVETLAFGPTVAGAPYSADEVTEFSQTLADGTRIQREDRVAVYRDGEGRVRRETAKNITITDPVAGAAYVLDPNTLTGRKIRFGVAVSHIGARTDVRVVARYAEAARGGGKEAVGITAPVEKGNVAFVSPEVETLANAGASGPPPPPPPPPQKALYFVHAGPTDANRKADSQSLGSQSIEGVVSEGTRITETLPAGAIGNDRPIQTVNERWYSPDLKVVMMTKRTDPRTGDETFHLTNVRRGEPDAYLFQPPAGYQITGN